MSKGSPGETSPPTRSSSMSVTLAFAVPRATVMVVSSRKAPSMSSPISITLSGGEPLTVSTLPVQLTFFGSVRPKVDSQLCWAPLMVPHPASEMTAQPATTRHNADLAYPGTLGIFRPMLDIIHDARRIGPEDIGSGSDVRIPVPAHPEPPERGGSLLAVQSTRGVSRSVAASLCDHSAWP